MARKSRAWTSQRYSPRWSSLKIITWTFTWSTSNWSITALWNRTNRFQKTWRLTSRKLHRSIRSKLRRRKELQLPYDADEAGQPRPWIRLCLMPMAQAVPCKTKVNRTEQFSSLRATKQDLQEIIAWKTQPRQHLSVHKAFKSLRKKTRL